MATYFSALQTDGKRIWYNVTADRPHELDFAAETYRVRVHEKSGHRWIEINPRQRELKSYLESDLVGRMGAKAGRDEKAVASDGNYKWQRRLTDRERELTHNNAGDPLTRGSAERRRTIEQG